MSSISHRPTIQEFDQQVEAFADQIVRQQIGVKPIAAYGFFIAQSNEKPASSLLVNFYHAFVAIPKPGYDVFVARFNDDALAISGFEDAIAKSVAMKVLARGIAS